MKLQDNRKLYTNQRGIVSITVTVIIMIIISLIVLGFARLTRREQRQSLDRQLSTQAYYAAETAINDTVKKLGEGVVDMTVDYNDDCAQFTALYGLTPQIDGPGGSTSYSCLFVDPSPISLEYGNVDVNASKVIPIKAKDGGAIDSISLGWQDKAGGTTLTGCNSNGALFPQELPASTWWTNCDTGVMRVDLVPIAASINRNSLVDASMTIYLYPSVYGPAPTSGSYTSNRGFGNQGNIIRVGCQSPPISNPKQCTYTINGLGGTNYVMRVKSIYRSSAMTITAARGPSSLELTGAQAEVDATGKASDVLRRVKVRVPISTFGSPFPEFAVQAVDTVCKKFEIAPPSYYFPDSAPNCDVLAP